MSLVDQFSSGNQKVVEGVGTSLMSLALYNGFGPSYVGSQVMKRTASKDSKGKQICAGFRLLRDVVNEFGNEALHGQKVIDFVKLHGFGHKDMDVRETAKELTTAIFLRDASSVIPMLNALSEQWKKVRFRLLRQYK
jgi:hypothetical protein